MYINREHYKHKRSFNKDDKKSNLFVDRLGQSLKELIGSVGVMTRDYLGRLCCDWLPGDQCCVREATHNPPSQLWSRQTFVTFVSDYKYVVKVYGAGFS